MKISFLLLSLFFYTPFIFSQTTWSDDAAEVFYNKCTFCHNPDGIAPFSLIDYSTAYALMSSIETAVEENSMPPWTADSSFQHYFSERLLSEHERNTILDWVTDGGIEGDPEMAPPPPVYTGEQILAGTPDLVIEMPRYMSKATSEQDDYICISLPTGLLENKKIKAIEVIPGNRAILHHCLVYIDPDATYETDSTGGDCGGPSSDAGLLTGYVPGATPTVFPSSIDFATGMNMPAGSNVILAMHYPEGSYGEFDQTKVNFYFYNDDVPDFREIVAAAFLQNWSFTLPPDELTSVTASYSDVPYDLTVLSVFPHMHLLGETITAYSVSPSLDTIPFVRIPEWDFEWQDFYWFRYMQKMVAGSELRADGVFDNTASNPNNPNDPPIEVNPGFNTTDEMFLVYFHLMEYQDGDEFINVDSLNTIYLNNNNYDLSKNSEIITYPNPFDKSINIEYYLPNTSYVSVFIYDINGKLIKKLYRGQQNDGQQYLIWDGTTTDSKQAANGIYIYSILMNGKHYSGRIIKKQ